MYSYVADATILPYNLCSGSGVMFDGLAHDLSFVVTCFKRIGIIVKRDPAAFGYALKDLDRNYKEHSQRVQHFKEKLKARNEHDDSSNAKAGINSSNRIHFSNVLPLPLGRVRSLRKAPSKSPDLAMSICRVSA